MRWLFISLGAEGFFNRSLKSEWSVWGTRQKCGTKALESGNFNSICKWAFILTYIQVLHILCQVKFRYFPTEWLNSFRRLKILPEMQMQEKRKVKCIFTTFFSIFWHFLVCTPQNPVHPINVFFHGSLNVGEEVFIIHMRVRFLEEKEAWNSIEGNWFPRQTGLYPPQRFVSSSIFS